MIKELTQNITADGMVFIPATIRRKAGIDVGDSVAVTTCGSKIVLERYAPTACAICGKCDDTIPIKGKYLCNACIDAVLAAK